MSGVTGERASAGLDLPSLQDRRARYGVFFATYLYQGLVAGFSLTALANHLAALGLPASEVGLHFAIAGLPWTLQPILWGPLVDRASRARMGRRRVWSVVAILGGQAALGGLLLLPGPQALGALGLVFLLHSVFAALLDTACDRLVMDHVPEAELGRTSACTRVGFVVGTSLGAALFGWTLAAYGFRESVQLLLLLSACAALPALLVREAPGDALLSLGRHPLVAAAVRPLPFRRFLRRLRLGLSRPRALRLIGLCFAIDGALAAFELRFGVDLVQGYGWDAAALSRVQAGLALLGGTAGALAVGLWADRAGPLPALRHLCRASATAFLIAAGLVAAGLAGTAGPAILGLTNVLPGLLVVALVPALMRASRGRVGAATEFEVYMATMNLGSVTGGAVSGALAPVLPLSLVAGLCGLVLAGCAVLAGRPHLILRPAREPQRPSP
ncbi:PAT family beta-lactamase induction signal transducer AmpG [Methylobacterium sp. BE186]|uniref:MFS transporter n=1 Tax=Methylobacterium sp. BE186 TaxID=2817715 RepID=UPI00285CD7B0|nr:MFS transporter [Methylobacterium sp. BE186]MDR7037657.1 PAT family beta-lactamase induction signal transducer AmpG [Methylobacterium sp. BE186]